MLAQAGVPVSYLPLIGAGEVLPGILILGFWNVRAVFAANVCLMLLATIAVAVNSPAYLTAAFNPVTLNFAMIALSVCGWLASRDIPSARHCLRKQPKEQP